MKTSLPSYAGDRREGEEENTTERVINDSINKIGVMVAKKALTTIIQGLSGAIIGSGPAGLTSLLIINAAKSIVEDSYRPVETRIAKQSPLKVYIESVRNTVGELVEKYQEVWTSAKNELTALGAQRLNLVLNQIKSSRAEIKKSFYADLTIGYLKIAPNRSLELPTPHARYTGKERGWNRWNRTWVTRIYSREIYTEIHASNYNEDDIEVIRTIIPELPSDVLAKLNQLSIPVAILPFNSFIIEGNSPLGPIRVVFKSGRPVMPAITPSFSSEFCERLSKQHGVRGDRSALRLDGAALLYSWIVTRPMNTMKFNT